jgi:hypothetical protein
MGQLRNDVSQRFTVGNTCLGWSRILKLFLKRGKEEEVKRQRRRERMQRGMRRIIVMKLQDCSKKINILESTILDGLDGASRNLCHAYGEECVRSIGRDLAGYT